MELELKALEKNYGKKRALKGINLTLHDGVYGILGPNGAGKSTMMNIITGNLMPSSGSVLFNGTEINKLGKAFRSRIGYMPQQQVFYPGMSVEHFLYYMASLRGLSNAEAKTQIDWSLKLLCLEDVRKQPIRALSGGMRQRLLLAQAIIAKPDILILDEPTAGLDPSQRIAVRNLISEIAENRIVLISTHIVSDIEFVANQIIILSDGNVLSQSAPNELTQQLEGRVWETSIEEALLPSVRQLGMISGISRDQNGFLVRILCDCAPTKTSVAVRPTLEDIYLYYFGGPKLT